MCILVVLRKRVEEDRLAAVEVSGTFVGRNTIRPDIDHVPRLSRGRRLDGETGGFPAQITHQHRQASGSNSSLESRSI